MPGLRRDIPPGEGLGHERLHARAACDVEPGLDLGARPLELKIVERIKLIRELQDLGLTLDEIGAMLRDVGEHEASCEQEAARFRAALARMEQKLAALATVRDRLARALARCTSGECTIIEQVTRVTTTASSKGARSRRSAGRADR